MLSLRNKGNEEGPQRADVLGLLLSGARTLRRPGVIAFILLLSFWVLPWGRLRAQTPHNIVVSWTLSPSSGITSEKVYRGTTTGGPYTVQTTLGPTVTSYTDTSIVAGTKYFYVITALAGTNESGFSPETSATAVGNPLPPSGVTAVSN